MASVAKYTNYILMTETIVSGYRKRHGPPKSLFKSKEGVNDATNEFIEYCLETEEKGID